MALNFKSLKAGQHITIVNKGWRKSYYSDSKYEDTDERGNAHLYIVTKVGQKYVHGKYVWMDQGEIKAGQETRVDTEDYLIFDGFHEEYVTQYRLRGEALRRWDEEQKNARRTFEHEAYQITRAKEEQWEKEHPRPPPIDLAKLENKPTPIFLLRRE